jgi:hypothetical protein
MQNFPTILDTRGVCVSIGLVINKVHDVGVVYTTPFVTRCSISLHIIHFLSKNEFQKSMSLKVSIAAHDLFGTLNAGRGD